MPEQPSSSDQNETAAGDVLALHSRDAADRKNLDPRLRSIVRLLARQAARAYYADTRKEAGSSKI
jgi:hypothetical protein